ncbi:hypothetical protein RSAG8_11527, partial [Rhizoctonia solani AG-8 WAC10335]
MGFGTHLESKLVNASVAAAPTFQKIGQFADKVGMGGVTAAATNAASAVLPTVRNCVAHVDAENDRFKLWKKTAEDALVLRNEGAPSKELFSWVLAHKNQLPGGAFECGKNIDGSEWYACRTFRMGGLHVGKSGKMAKDPKTGELVRRPALFRIDGSDVEIEDYEVLTINTPEDGNYKNEGVKPQWVPSPSPFKADDRNFIGKILVPGGSKHDGTVYYVARAEYFQGTHPSMVNEDMRNVSITFGGKEIVSAEVCT